MAGHLKSLLAELIGTFAFVFIGASAVSLDSATGGKLGPLGVALAHGFALAAMIQAYGRVSGGYFNPAVTAAMAMTRKLDSVRAVLYAASQLLGAALAGLLLKASFQSYPALSEAAPFLGSCGLSGVGYRMGTLLEAIAAFLLVAVTRASSKPGSARNAPLSIGLTFAACQLVLAPLSGGGINPALVFGPSVVTGHWSHWYVYWVGPLTGSLASAWMHETLFADKKR